MRHEWRRTRLGAADGKMRFARVSSRMHICFDCRMYLYWLERQRYFVFAGEDHGLGYIRPSSALREAWTKSEADAIHKKREDDAAAELELDGLIGESDGGAGERSVGAERIFGDGRLRTYLEAEKATNELFDRERADLKLLAGEPAVPFLRRYEQASFLATVRRLLSAYLTVRMNVLRDIARGEPRVAPSIRVVAVRHGPISQPT